MLKFRSRRRTKFSYKIFTPPFCSINIDKSKSLLDLLLLYQSYNCGIKGRGAPYYSEIYFALVELVNFDNMGNRKWRHKRIRSKIMGTKVRPRFSIFKSNRYLYVQLIDDGRGVTLAAGDTRKIKSKTKLEGADKLGREIAGQANIKKIKRVVFDRGGYKYHGLIRAIADGARQEGLIF